MNSPYQRPRNSNTPEWRAREDGLPERQLGGVESLDLISLRYTASRIKRSEQRMSRIAGAARFDSMVKALAHSTKPLMKAYVVRSAVPGGSGPARAAARSARSARMGSGDFDPSALLLRRPSSRARRKRKVRPSAVGHAERSCGAAQGAPIASVSEPLRSPDPLSQIEVFGTWPCCPP